MNGPGPAEIKGQDSLGIAPPGFSGLRSRQLKQLGEGRSRTHERRRELQGIETCFFIYFIHSVEIHFLRFFCHSALPLRVRFLHLADKQLCAYVEMRVCLCVFRAGLYITSCG